MGTSKISIDVNKDLGEGHLYVFHNVGNVKVITQMGNISVDYGSIIKDFMVVLRIFNKEVGTTFQDQKDLVASLLFFTKNEDVTTRNVSVYYADLSFLVEEDPKIYIKENEKTLKDVRTRLGLPANNINNIVDVLLL